MKSGFVSSVCLTFVFFGWVWGAEQADVAESGDQLNVVLITLDDFGFDSCGVTGCTIPEITPNIDHLAREGIRFEHAFVMTSICGPSRAVMLTGRYPHSNGIMGHGGQPPVGWKSPQNPTPDLIGMLNQGGYFTAAILKIARAGAATSDFDKTWDEGPFGIHRADRDPEAFYRRTKESIECARREDKPFFIYVNPIDPHEPWPGTPLEQSMRARWNPDDPPPAPPRRFQADEVFVPPFLPDLPQVRELLVPYYESVSRGDQCVGRIVDALRDTGQYDRTLVIFCSDHGIALPGGKWSLFDASMRTPLIVRWPGKTSPGAVDCAHVVSTVDFAPTILDAVGLAIPRGLDGRSLVPLLRDQPSPPWRDAVFLEQNYFNESDGANFYPVRGLASRRYLYLWNAYVPLAGDPRPYYGSDHDLIKLFKSLGEVETRLAERAHHYVFRPAEELYDLEKDPGCWTNLVGRPDKRKSLHRLRLALLSRMTESADPQVELFQQTLSAIALP